MCIFGCEFKCFSTLGAFFCLSATRLLHDLQLREGAATAALTSGRGEWPWRAAVESGRGERLYKASTECADGTGTSEALI